jgi:integrase/recombinase XerD
VPLSERIEPLLASWFEKHESLGVGERSLQRILKNVAQRAGLGDRVCATALRHTFAVAAVTNGASPLELQRLLGLKHLAATEVYFELAGRLRSETISGPAGSATR